MCLTDVRHMPMKLFIPPCQMASLSSSELAAQRLAEAPVIEQEWNTMSYKDRAAWWLSAKWYGYMSSDDYRRGQVSSNPNESCRYGEPGFLIATRIPYFEPAAAAAVTVPSAPAVSSKVAEAPQTVEPVSESVQVSEPSVAPSEPDTTKSETSSAMQQEPSDTETMRNAIVRSIDTTTSLLAAAVAPTTSQTSQPSQTNQKKKKKQKHNGEQGKTVQIRLGVTGGRHS
jgi:DNA polymerase III gamma/tau subunit